MISLAMSSSFEEAVMSSPPLAETFKQHLLAIAKAITHSSIESISADQRPPFDVVYPIVEDGMQRIHRDLVEGTTEHYATAWLTIGSQQAQIGMPLEVVLGFIALTEKIVIEHLAPLYSGDAGTMRALFEQIYAICNYAKTRLFHVYSDAREVIIRSQTAAIQELSAPLIPIYRGVLVLPLIGAIDSQRAGTIMETLLDGIARQSASVVLLDITGVPVVDTSVAHHLIQSARAVRLLGAEIVLVGISPEIAQTIVQLGVNLSDIITRSDLEAGFAYALKRFGLTIAASLPAS
jgi:rsbT co-antagonist protein RsbR